MPFTKNSTATNSSRSLSGFWSDCPIDAIRNGAVDGFYFHDDFVNAGVAGSGFAVGNCGIYQAYTSTGATIAATATQGGALTFSPAATADLGCGLCSSTSSVLISTASKNVWFEARIKTSTIADTKHGIFCGLTETFAPSVILPIAADGTLADKNFVGFHRLEGDGDMLDCVHKADGGGITQVTDLADAITLVADTYVNVGIKWDLAAGYLYFYKNGVVVKSVASSLVGASASPTSFPNDSYLGLCCSIVNASGASPGTTTLDWWALSQLI